MEVYPLALIEQVFTDMCSTIFLYFMGLLGSLQNYIPGNSALDGASYHGHAITISKCRVVQFSSAHKLLSFRKYTPILTYFNMICIGVSFCDFISVG